ncbi:MAG: hypothetical protein K0B11_15910 [Mariniphaga sp.]|nr:hypothetical protein [Mariniphaga sp.]
MKKLADYRILFILVATLIFVIQTAFSQIPEITWEKDFKINSSHYFSDVLELPGGNFILLGAKEMPGERNFDIWLLECNSLGDTLKTKVFENPGNDIPMRIIANGEDGLVVVLMNSSENTGLMARLIALDSAFTELWSTVTKQQSALMRTDVTVDQSGQIWWLNTFAGEGGKPVVSLWKLDSQGNKTAEFNIENGTTSGGYAIRTLQDGTLGISFQVQPASGKATVQILRIDTDGKKLWKTTLPQSEKILTPQCLCCSPDNAMLVGGWAGLCYNPDAPEEEQIWDYDYLLSKLDATGKVLWTQNYNREGSEKGTAIAVLPDGNIMAAGKCETSFTGTIGPWLLMVDKNGKMVKDTVFKFRFVHDQAARIICTSDGGLLMVGPGFVETDRHLVGWVKKLNPVL